MLKSRPHGSYCAIIRSIAASAGVTFLGIITRYVFVDLLKVFLLTLGVMTLMMFLGLMGKEAVDSGLGLGGLLRLTPYILPEAMQFTLPGALLLATTGVFGRMAASNEVVAVKSLGIPPLTIAWPAICFSVVISLAAVLLNDLAVSWGRMGRERVLIESMETVAYSQLRTRGSFSMGPVSVNVRGVEGTLLIGPTIVREAHGNKPSSIITADSAQFKLFPEQGKLEVPLTNAELVSGEDTEVIGGDQVLELSLDDLLGRSNSTRSPSNHALSEISTARKEQQRLIREIEQDMTTRAAYALLTGEFEELGEEQWKDQQRNLETAANRLARFRTEPYRRWSNGFSCLAFALVGIPVAIIFRKGEFLASFFICFLPILIAYYPLFMGSLIFAKNGTVPPQTVWIANVVLMMCGVWLLRRVIRY
jgi:lipopolysaccharide export system permease protein